MNVRCEGNTESVPEVMCTSNVSKCLCSSLGAILGPRLCASRKCNRMFNISMLLYSTSSNEDTRASSSRCVLPRPAPLHPAPRSRRRCRLRPSPRLARVTRDCAPAMTMPLLSAPPPVRASSIHSLYGHGRLMRRERTTLSEAFGRLPHRADAQIPSQRLPPTVLDFTRPRPFHRPRA